MFGGQEDVSSVEPKPARTVVPLARYARRKKCARSRTERTPNRHARITIPRRKSGKTQSRPPVRRRRRIPCRAELRNALAGRKLHDPGTVRCRGAGTQYGAQGVPDTQHHAAHERVPCPAPLPGRVARLSAGCRNRCRSRRTGNRQKKCCPTWRFTSPRRQAS